ncbi:MAG: PEP-utilizing enzyme [Candidatus Micrarchaeota archaeon]
MEKWVKVDIRNDASLFPIFLFESGCGKNSSMQKALGASYKGLMYPFKGDAWGFYEIEGDTQRVAEILGKKVASDPDFVEHAIKETYRLGKRMLELTGEISSITLASKSNAQLWTYYSDYCKRCKEMRGYAWIAPALDLSSALSDKLRGIIRRHLPDATEDQLSILFTTLTNPKKFTLGKQQDMDLLEIAALIKSPKFIHSPQIQKLLIAHTKKYGWLPCTYENDPWKKEHFESVLESMLKQKTDAKKELEKIKNKEKEDEIKRKSTISLLELSKSEIKLFDIASDLIFFKADRKDILFRSYFEMRSLIAEIAKRLHLTPKQVRFMLPNEIKEALKNRPTNPSLYNERFKFSVAISKDDSTEVYVGKEAQRIMREDVLEEKIIESKELRGQCACPGFAKGTVKLILSPKDMHKMNQGDILVAPATNPDIVPAMKKAAAIITNTGGLTCHAAIVSRELGIPCIVGTKIATDVLKDGMMVELNATKGIVGIIK